MKAGWETEKLGTACSLLNRGISPKYIESSGIRVLNQKCIRDHRVSYEQARRHDLAAKAVSESRYIQLGDVLVNSTGTGTLGRVAQVREVPEEPTTVDSHVTIVRPKQGKFYQDFFGYMLILIEEKIKEAGEGCGGQTELARSVLAENFSVSYPTSIVEQQRIVAILDQAFESIAKARANAEQNLQNARALFESYLHSIDAEEKEFGNFVSIKTGKLDANAAVKGGAYPFFTCSREVYRIDKFAFDCEAILLAGNNASGDFNVKHYIGKFNAYQRTYVITVKNENEASYRYLYFQLLAKLKEFKKQSVGSNTKFLKIGMIQGMKIPMPSFVEQETIVVKLDRLLTETQRLEAFYQCKITCLDELKKSLLQQAFAGELIADIQPSNIILLPTKKPMSSTDVHAGILALAYQKHENKGNVVNFGHVKAEKIAHMVEAMLSIDLGRAPFKDAAGPNDYPHLKSVESRARKAGYFDFKQVNISAYRVTKLNKFDEITDKTRTFLAEEMAAIDKLLELMLPMDTQQAEIFCTVYAAWNNLLLDGMQPTDEAIVYEARENWHPDKLKIPREKFFAAITWMRNKQIVPKGTGKKVLARNPK